MDKIISAISQIGIVPVIKLEDAKDAVPLAGALCQGGLPCAEITFRTPAAEDSIRAVTKAFPDMLVGAGTVLTPEQADRAADAGASFIVSPGFNADTVSHCLEKNIPILPGCSTPSEVEQAMSFGLDTVKFFPAEAAGGLAMIKAMSAPYRNMKFMPTGGISSKNLNTYLNFKKVIACGGSFMAPDSLIAAQDFEGIARLTREAVSVMLGFEIAHIEIAMTDRTAVRNLPDTFSTVFSCSFLGRTDGEPLTASVTHVPHATGQITVRTNDIRRAVSHLERQSLWMDKNTEQYNDKKELSAINLAESYGGFTIQIIQK